MSKKAKQLVTDEYKRWFEGVNSVCIVDLTGLDAIATHKLRGQLRQKKIQLHVVRNALIRRALAGGPLEPLTKVLTGPCATVTGGDSIVEVAKELVRLAGEIPAIKLKVGMLEGDPEIIPLDRLAKMKSRRDLQGEVLMLILSPWRRVAGQITSPWKRVAGCVKALAEKAEAEKVEAA
jgi:large subunit ribosomal protein L10